MEINTISWAKFHIGDIFRVVGGFYNKKPEHSVDGKIPFLAATDSNNGVTEFYSESDIRSWNKVGEADDTLDHKIFDGGCIAVTVNGSVCNAYYQTQKFTCSHDISALYLKEHELTKNIALFLCTIIQMEKYRWSYGRKPHDRNKLRAMTIKLPVDSQGKPNWMFMETSIEEVQRIGDSKDDELSKSIFTRNKNTPLPAFSNLKKFKISQIFSVKYGINLELNSLQETSVSDPDGIAFVARTSENNGVTAYVKPTEDTPQPSGTITVAGGGSVLSTFVQKRPFYSGRDLYLLLPKKAKISLFTKLYICTVIKANQYRYSYGRQANKTLPDIELLLPAKEDGEPDYRAMDDYVKKLPFSDRIS
jgi:hypothetical protein